MKAIQIEDYGNPAEVRKLGAIKPGHHRSLGLHDG
jgi:hypothetical protein